jgi:hypothetical protein
MPCEYYLLSNFKICSTNVDFLLFFYIITIKHFYFFLTNGIHLSCKYRNRELCFHFKTKRCYAVSAKENDCDYVCDSSGSSIWACSKSFALLNFFSFWSRVYFWRKSNLYYRYFVKLGCLLQYHFLQKILRIFW